MSKRCCWITSRSGAGIVLAMGWLTPAVDAAAPPRPLVTPYAQQGPLAIRQIYLNSATIPRMQRVEMTIELSATYDNPFDSADVALEARVRTPGGRLLVVPGFLYRAFKRELKSGKEVLTPEGQPSWRLRYAVQEAGPHSAVVVLRDRTGTAESTPVSFTGVESPHPGWVRISRRDRRYFEFDSGQAMFPVGANTCWAYARGTYDYDEWFPRYAAAKANFGRLWLSPHWTTFALEQPGAVEAGKGLGQFDLANAWRIDYVLELGTQHGLWLKLCIDSYNILREKDGYPQWDATPHNAKHGGPLQRPTDFWTDATMDRLYRDKLRYLVARYGALSHVFAWEFWNEADITTGYRTAPARDWHQRMARVLRDLDPYDHLITTSFANTRGDPEIDRLPELDYVQSHHYNSPDLAQTIARTQATKAAYGKPHYFGEIGADSGGPRREDDPEGLQVHDPLWVSVVTAGSGAAQSWWWDNLIHPRNLYPLFTPLVKFTEAVDWPGEDFRVVTPTVAWREPPDPMPRQDVTLGEGPVSWEKSEFNRPRTVRITRAGVSGETPVAGIQHSLGGHRDKHNPVTFELDLPWPTKIEVQVGDVSGYGGAALTITLDGETVVARTFADDDPSTKTLTQHAATHPVAVPAGKHTVVVANPGHDWFMVSYRLRDAIEARHPPIVAWGMIGKTTALAWARNEERTWRNVCAKKMQIPPAAASVLCLPGVPAGEWQAAVWDTWGKGVVDRQTVSVPASGEARIVLPVMERDFAVRLRR